ncbi:hypothetical protein [Dermatophilus congolensis]|uniref:Uncharacterized protein conserved in bacteria n=1 Tax=Dermatophilus congolensis TaxID=1863 RepID=A0AA46GZQ2_9MICO|nr:hypothetical protein [Dermatophilus congolensis]MBO3142129.1 hypothetical protein [Dermatophilus congolensis]MBO3151121.1 hypothetical protein [Dermatophilus congolensis]MBO3161877.1 hypothetical protein [Dermatophilus congolensis]MBO3162404.1 hypothetical protein [Dermatophilus congolensis]MBO3175962.1 hypothetical protein [Dermatophilus congolensis]
MRYVPPSQRRNTDWNALAQTEKNTSDNASNAASRLVAYLIAGPVVYGGLGYLIDIWLGTRFGIAVGTLLGLGLSLYIVWLRYGGSQSPVPSAFAPHTAKVNEPVARPNVTASPGLNRTTSEEIS